MSSTEAGAGPGFRFAGFISYNRGVDLDLSADLQRALQRFAKPWYRLRALRIFRDLTVLTANPDAWKAVEQGLADSEYLILLASPQSAASEWVRREIQYWLAHKPHDKILVALTGGELVWDRRGNDFDWTRTTALPADVLRGVFSQVPNYVDLRPVKAVDGRQRERLFEALVPDLAAALHHRSKDDMIGEDRRVYRRNRQLAIGAVTGLVALTVASALFAVEAVSQAREADRQRSETEGQRRVAISRQLAAQSNLVGDTDPVCQGYSPLPDGASTTMTRHAMPWSTRLRGRAGGSYGVTAVVSPPRRSARTARLSRPPAGTERPGCGTWRLACRSPP